VCITETNPGICIKKIRKVITFKAGIVTNAKYTTISKGIPVLKFQAGEPPVGICQEVDS